MARELEVPVNGLSVSEFILSVRLFKEKRTRSSISLLCHISIPTFTKIDFVKGFVQDCIYIIEIR